MKHTVIPGSGSDSGSTFRLPGVYPNADGIRGLACLIVLLTHAVTMFYPKTVPYLAGSGKIGVWLFFVLSAYLLTSKMLKGIFDRYSLFAYVLGRFLRIFLLYIFSVIVYLKFGTAGIDTWTDVVDALVFIKGFSHLWTVPVEFKFYFFLPIIAYGLFIARRIGGASLVIASFSILVMVHQLIWPYSSTPINTIDLVYYLPTFVFGMLLALIPPDKLKFSSVTEMSVVGVVAVTVVLSTPGARYYLFGTALDYSLSSWFIQFGFIWAIFIGFTLNARGLFGKFLASLVMRKIGAWSYPVYLFHWLIYMKMISWWPENIFSMFLGVALAIGAGAVIHYFLESPIVLFRKKLQNNIFDSRLLAKRTNAQIL